MEYAMNSAEQFPRSMIRDKRQANEISNFIQQNTVKPVLSGPSKRRPKIVFKTDYRLM